MNGEQRRRAPRYTFIASAELLEPTTETRIATRVSELSKHGCYLDMLNPFPVGTVTLVKISEGDALFESKAQVVYAHANLGAGVLFLETEPKYVKVLQYWISEAEKDPERLL